MDQLISKIKDQQIAHAEADMQMAKSKLTYQRLLEDAYSALHLLKISEHELLIILANQKNEVKPQEIVPNVAE